MYHFKLNKEDKKICIVKDENDKDEHEIEKEFKSIFIGHHNILTLTGYVVGGILIGRSIWQYLFNEVGLLYTIAIGAVIFAISGAHAREFF